MNIIRVCLDRVSYYSKPEGKAIAQISDRIARQTIPLTAENIRGFVGDVGLDGHTFCPATFKNGKRNKDNFEQMQLFVLDFDNDTPDKQISFDSVKERADRYNLPVFFAYESFRSKNKDRFRVAFLNDVPIQSNRDAEVVQDALVTIFPECDKSSKDISKMYFGGSKDKLLFFDKEASQMNVVSAVTGMTSYLEEQHKNNYRRKVSEFIRNHGLRENSKKLPDVSIANELPEPENIAEITGVPHDDKISPNSTIEYSESIIEGVGENLSKKYYLIKYDNGTNISAKKKTSKNHKDFRLKDIPKLRLVCQLLREFETGSIRLSHDELFGLATNLTNVETGNDLFLNSFKANSYADGRVGKYGYWVHQLKKYIAGYQPQACNSFCRYCNSCSHLTNLLLTAKLKYHQMERIAGYTEPLYTLEEAEKDFQKKFRNAMDDTRKMWFIIKAQTALGKTETYLRLIKDTSKRILIVVPTNKLKSEIRRQRAESMGIEMMESPSLREIKDYIPDVVWDHIEYLYASGKSVIPYLKKLIREDHSECAKLFKKYLKDLDSLRNFDGHVITTHKRFLTMDVSKYDLVIIDEDILLGSIIQNKIDISISDLKKLQKKTAPGSTIRKKVNKGLKYIEEDEKISDYFSLPSIDYDKTDDDIAIGVDIPSFCSATRFLYRKVSDKENEISEDCITFIPPVKINPNMKYIMVSATVDKTVCEYFFGEENMEFYACKKARYEGALYQDYRRPMSRGYISENKDIIKEIKKWSGFDDTISFKRFMASYQGDLHFGNSAGCDYLKGKNLDVIGTPHIPDWIYKLFAYTIGCEFDTEAKIKFGITVEHNGWKFRFTSFDDKVLRAIQFYILESQLEQAVGRARLLRNQCKVNLFSNFPLNQAKMICDFDYDKD
ncbi:DEAD/DEAH box helicase family protein [Pelosinus propionicus]|uniref:Uncharacterized protein n=1 Tax=Pelosinus propionicus DSM 13327 TaxID=1123291 RepID=A0A1I4Q852_9FIRM|nr:hypothetical protein [Pelosinus propionicus]SFM36262.1 hypothetical protein SAMN04490355_10886 [Pelosinus propionicus DSM 13327]